MRCYIYIRDIGGTEQEFNGKKEFLDTLSSMIDDCEKNGGTYFDVEVESDVKGYTIKDLKEEK